MAGSRRLSCRFGISSACLETLVHLGINESPVIIDIAASILSRPQRGGGCIEWVRVENSKELVTVYVLRRSVLEWPA